MSEKQSSPAELPARARRILYASITEFIATNEPVGSRTLAKKYGLSLSAASIRNVLSDLEDAGFLRQPHTSAGRVPTEKAYRFFIDALMQVQPVPDEELRAIELTLQEQLPGDGLLRATGRLLSELTGTASLIIAPRLETRTLHQLRFIPTRPGELLAVLVFGEGVVENRFLPVDASIGEDEIQRVHNLLADVIDGRTLGEIRDLCAKRLADERVQVNALRRRAFELGQQAVEGMARSEVLIEGQARLLDSPDLSDLDRLKGLVVAMQDRQRLQTLLDETVRAERANVLVGHEMGVLGGGGMSVVAAPYTDRGRVAGAIGALGFMRMDYPKVVSLVAATAKAMSAAFDRSADEGRSWGGKDS
ncbi:MAG: heat-inducible transcriptional repressor HrcA [Polyangiaceae bacterium]|nr:heat-inducible transcriptional repressor HrcA [Polyangiaceae bacterium]